MKNLPILMLLGALFYLIYEGKSGMKKVADKIMPPPFESTFNEGIPSEYSPQDVHQFGTVDKLEGDLRVRRMKMRLQMKSEEEELQKLGDEKALQELRQKHEDLYEKLKISHEALREQYLLRKEEDAVRNKDLR